MGPLAVKVRWVKVRMVKSSSVNLLAPVWAFDTGFHPDAEVAIAAARRAAARIPGVVERDAKEFARAGSLDTGKRLTP